MNGAATCFLILPHSQTEDCKSMSGALTANQVSACFNQERLHQVPHKFWDADLPSTSHYWKGCPYYSLDLLQFQPPKWSFSQYLCQEYRNTLTPWNHTRLALVTHYQRNSLNIYNKVHKQNWNCNYFFFLIPVQLHLSVPKHAGKAEAEVQYMYFMCGGDNSATSAWPDQITSLISFSVTNLKWTSDCSHSHTLKLKPEVDRRLPNPKQSKHKPRNATCFLK